MRTDTDGLRVDSANITLLGAAVKHTPWLYSEMVASHTQSRLARPFLALVVAASLALAVSPAAADTELVAGQPPLTQEMVGTISDFYAWVLDVHLTQRQLGDLQDSLVRAWQKHDADEIDATLEGIKLHDSVVGLGASERTDVRAKVLSQLLPQLRSQPNQPTSSWVLGVYDAANRPIAAGSPPLTRLVSDASAEMMLFVLSVALQGTPLMLDQTADTAFKDIWAQSLVDEYAAGLRTSEQQAEMANTPQDWAAMRAAWPALTPDEQDQYHAEWLASINAAYPDPVAETAPEADPPAMTPIASSTPWSDAKWATAMKLPAMRMHP